MKTFKTQSEIERKIVSLGEQLTIHLSKEAREHGIVLVANLKGAFMFLSDLAKSISFMGCEIDFIKTNRGNSDANSLSLDHLNVKGKTVVFVEDIIDSGETLTFVKQQFEKLGVNRFVSAALLVRGSKSAAITDYYCFQLNTDDFVIGYGMDDVDGTKRNLPNLYLRENK